MMWLVETFYSSNHPRIQKTWPLTDIRLLKVHLAPPPPPPLFFIAQINLIWIISSQEILDLVQTSIFYDLLILTKFGSRPRKERSGANQSCDVNRFRWNFLQKLALMRYSKSLSGFVFCLFVPEFRWWGGGVPLDASKLWRKNMLFQGKVWQCIKINKNILLTYLLYGVFL